MNREKVSEKNIKSSIQEVINRIREKNARKGGAYGYSWASTHEIHGKLAEEMHELLVEMHLNKLGLFRDELIDIAVAAIWGIASIETFKKKMK